MDDAASQAAGTFDAPLLDKRAITESAAWLRGITAVLRQFDIQTETQIVAAAWNLPETS